MIKELYRSKVDEVNVEKDIYSETINKMKVAQQERANKKNNLLKWSTIGVGFVASIAMLFFVINSIGINSDKDPKIAEEDSIINEITPEDITADNDSIISDSILMIKRENGESSKINIDLNEAIVISWKIDDCIEYLELDPRPKFIPENMEEVLGKKQRVYKDKSGEMIKDDFRFYYSDEGIKELIVQVSKGKIPFRDYSYMLDNEEISLIGGNEAVVGYYELNKNEIKYFSEFIYRNVGYYITAENIEQEEFIRVIKSIFEEDIVK